MISIFGGGIGREFDRQAFKLLSRPDQDAILQGMYDDGRYSVPEIGNYLGMSEAALYKRIDAHRGRGPAPKPAT